MGKNILIIEPDDITRVLLAKEVEQTNNIPLGVDDINSGFDVVRKKNVSMIICDNDLLEGFQFAGELKKSGFDIPMIATSTFLSNHKFMEKEGFWCSLRKPLDGEGYSMLREGIRVLKKIR